MNRIRIFGILFIIVSMAIVAGFNSCGSSSSTSPAQAVGMATAVYIDGKVTNSTSNLPIVGATVTTNNPNIGAPARTAITDNTGYYKLLNGWNGGGILTIQVTAQANGYLTQARDADATINVQVNFPLIPTATPTSTSTSTSTSTPTATGT